MLPYSQKFWLGAMNELEQFITSGLKLYVYTAGGNTLATIYSDEALSTAAANPLTCGTDGIMSFWGPAATETYDVVVRHALGETRLQAFSAYQHVALLSRQMALHHLVIPFIKKTSEFDSTFDLPLGAMVTDALIEVITNVASGTISVGLLASETNGDADGFVVTLSCATAGLYRAQAAVTAGGSETYFSANTRGALLSDYIVGTNANGDFGLYREKPHIVQGANAVSVSYTTSNHDIAGNIHLFYVPILNRY